MAKTKNTYLIKPTVLNIELEGSILKKIKLITKEDQRKIKR